MCQWWPYDLCYQMMAAALWQLSQLQPSGTPLNTCGRSNNEHSNQLRWASSMAPKKKPEPVIGGLSLATPVLQHASGRQDCFHYSNCHCTTTTTNTTATNPTPAARPPTKHLGASPLFGVHALALSKTHTCQVARNQTKNTRAPLPSGHVTLTTLRQVTRGKNSRD